VEAENATQSPEVIWLLNSVAEQLKMPLTTIARHAELGQSAGKGGVADLSVIRTHAEAALTLVDSYMLGLQLMREQGSLALEPVSISSVLVETAHELDGLARQYKMRLELEIAGRYEPVMAHRFGLKAALLALGYALLESGPQAGGRNKNLLVLAAHRTAHGITTGLYGDYEHLNAATWRRARALRGKATQPMNALSGNGAGLFVAEAILGAMSAVLRAGKYNNQQGFAATLPPSQQLTLV
jgi:hypothetical protein